ncbi:YjjI family glycine radical enzyme [Anaerosolibacter carboniphilus]|uniref:YjjI family glycine radical enzyme n=1 Tax=Anaerosolibacter carboniphilus TaxID=1417629 RepID=A0A841L4Y8_9FIRM|nr:YjjI family glycine radical enzyme [Anaerosolibacter carboniphilus]MBB6217385.1 YjjI family glycine radical enzyme [Anaerosolibacter carboniphilus]
MNNTINVIKDQTLTYQQKVIQLAREAENGIQVLNISQNVKSYMDKGIICDMFEGNAPYRPRYILPDYQRFMKQGSNFLGLQAPESLGEAINHLLILYKHVPSITSFPVFLGELDQLLEPFIDDEEEAYKAIKLFLTHIDRTLTDSFVHANIGPKATKAGRLILKAEKELKNAVPNLTLKYNKDTEREFALEAISTGLEVSKPYFANHEMFVQDFGTAYGTASCYNGLPIGGGSYTLVRLNLKKLAEEAGSLEEFLKVYIPRAVQLMNILIDERIRFLVEESGFFESSFLVEEELVRKDRFTAMFGIFGLAQCVNLLLDAKTPKERYGHSEKAMKLGYDIIKTIEREVNQYESPYCIATGKRFLLHAQSGISGDVEETAGCRIPIGEEPELMDHILHAANFHPLFPSGISDIFTFETTARKNPEFVLNIIQGAMEKGLRMFAFSCSDNDLMRITGYLVKKSEMKKLKEGQQVLHDTVGLGLEAAEKQNLYDRKVTQND